MKKRHFVIREAKVPVSKRLDDSALAGVELLILFVTLVTTALTLLILH